MSSKIFNNSVIPKKVKNSLQKLNIMNFHLHLFDFKVPLAIKFSNIKSLKCFYS